MGFDFLENITVVYLMIKYPQTTSVAYLAPYFTLMKWLFLYLAFGLLIIGISIKVFQIVKKRMLGR